MTPVITIPLREFAVPAPRRGSLELHSSMGRAADEGREIHLRVQKLRARTDPLYQAEVPISGSFDRQRYILRVEGRMDGVFRRDTPVIEEIKSAFALPELLSRLKGDPYDHPYSLQLLTYGYLYWREQQVVPRLILHLVSSRTGRGSDLELLLDIPRYETWLGLRLAELDEEARLAEKRSARRRKAAEACVFPFAAPRQGQPELIAEIQEGMRRNQPMLIQAPTGLGKTIGVLFPVLREALGRGQQTVYVTPKNSQHAVAEDAAGRLQEAGAPLRCLTITARGRICFKEEPLCTPEFCEYARDYHTKVRESGLPGILAGKRKLKAKLFRRLGEEHEVCPYELQLESAGSADLVICDYNYVFATRSALGRIRTLALDQSGKPNLIVDEAHNLPARAMEYQSPELSSRTLEELRHEIAGLPSRFRGEAGELLEKCIAALHACGGGAPRPIRIDPPVESLQALDARLSALLARYLESDTELGQRDALLSLCFLWSDFTRALEQMQDPARTEFFTTWHPHPATLRVTCCDPSAALRECWGEYQQVVAFSGTLKPFDYYANLSGLDPDSVRVAEFPTPFPAGHRKLLIIPQVSTRYGLRERNYGRIADAVSRIAAVRLGNYLVFFPSFLFLERVASLFHPPDGFNVIRQERGMGNSRIEEILTFLREGTTPTLLFAVQGGSFSEGVDYAGTMAVGAFVVGPPLPTFDLEREGMRHYYQARFGSGFEYAYVLPAMARAVQAAGRVIRSEQDRGLIVLMDRRFLEDSYTRAMPADWFEENAGELVSDSILGDVAKFWADQEDPSTGDDFPCGISAVELTEIPEEA